MNSSFLRRYQHVLILVVVSLSSATFLKAQQPGSKTEKPWTYWWWMGSAVDAENIRYQLNAFSKAGFGGIHIIPIYGVKGEERNVVPFLSSTWLTFLNFTIKEADKLGMGVDMSMGTGWPFGGPGVTSPMAAKKFQLSGGEIVSVPTGQMVKRAAPGGAGLVLDHFDLAAVANYLNIFDVPLAASRNRLRSIYSDSYEVYGANWTDDFLKHFKQRRGYALEDHVTEFFDSTGTTNSILIRMDYHQTIAELLHDHFTKQWTTWATDRSFMTRYQAHGSPGNLLDLYALADIPETESFGMSAFPIPGLRVDEHYEVKTFGTPDPLAMKFASSAASLTGKRLVSAETATWLGDHFKVSLSQVKPQVDELFTSGINHIFYHGITYSPKHEGFPGWLFYASTNFGLQSHLWKDIGQLNGYVQRCQHILQNSSADNDVLVYFPIHDLWSTDASGAGGIHQLDVHHTERWLRSSPFGKLCIQLQEKGVTFDYLSDSLLMQLTVDSMDVTSPGSRYKVLLIPPVKYMPERSLSMLNRLSSQGVIVIFMDLPTQNPGYIKSTTYTKVLDSLRTGKATVRTNVLASLDRNGVLPEDLAQNGLRFIRKKDPDNKRPFYFISNLNNKFNRGWIQINSASPGYRKYDPLNDRSEMLPLRTIGKSTQIFLELRPGESCFLFAEDVSTHEEITQPVSNMLTGEWNIAFLEGAPKVERRFVRKTLGTWTDYGDSAAFFYGTVQYSTQFNASRSMLSAKEVAIDLGIVREVADVVINGLPIGTAWSIPYRLTIPNGILKENNTLEIRVRNLSGNYMKLFDKLHPEWKKFYDINIVDIQYKPYDAWHSGILPSGLLTEVRIEYEK